MDEKRSFPFWGLGSWRCQSHQWERNYSLEVAQKATRWKSFKKNNGTPWKFNIAPEKWWLGRWISFWEGNFSGAMLNFRGVSLKNAGFLASKNCLYFLQRFFGTFLVSKLLGFFGSTAQDFKLTVKPLWWCIKSTGRRSVNLKLHAPPED